MTYAVHHTIETDPVLDDRVSMSRQLTSEIDAALTKHYHEFRRYLVRRISEPATAEDVLQTFCVRVINSGTVLRNSESAVAWLYTVLRSVLTDHYRSEAARRRREDSYMRDRMVLDEDQINPTHDKTTCGCLVELVPMLRPDYAEILERIDLSDEPREEVVADLKITPSNARVRLHRARQALRASLEAFCGACSEGRFEDCTCQNMHN
tara:strand:- start:519 stop:1142 length:624 start_codon:yes stop_codon:yes gene_type:complete